MIHTTEALAETGVAPFHPPLQWLVVACLTSDPLHTSQIRGGVAVDWPNDAAVEKVSVSPSSPIATARL